jgi:hypothetical protein
MDNIEFNSVEQVDELYLKLIEEYNEIATQFEELDALDDSIQELRCLNLDHYDFSLMSEVYASIDDNYTANECIENMEECEQEIDDIREKVAGVDLKEHLFNLYNLEYRKEQYEIQIAACEKYLEKCNKYKEMKKKKALIRPASPKRTVEEKRSVRPASPRRTGGSYTPEKKEKVENIPKLQTLDSIEAIPVIPTVPKLQTPTPPTPKPETPKIPPPVVPVVKTETKEPELQNFVLTNVPTVKKTREKKEKSEPKTLPVLSLPEITTPSPEVTPVAEKKKGGRKKKSEE